MIVVNNYRAIFSRQNTKLVLFDKDGTLVNDYGYVHKIRDFEWKTKGLELLKIASTHGAYICVVSNQSGIEKKIYSKRQSIKFCKHLIIQARKLNIEIKKIILCPHLETSKNYCNCRKPKIGMFLKLLSYSWAQNLDSIMVGNAKSDFEFSKNCGIPYIDVENIDSKLKLQQFLKNS